MPTTEELLAQLEGLATPAPKTSTKDLLSQLEGLSTQPKRVGMYDIEKPTQEPSFIQKAGDLFTGNLRKTPEMTGEGMPDQGKAMINDMSILGGQANQAKFALATTTMFDPNEIAKVAVRINPDLEVRHNKDAQGNIYPILTNTKTGVNSMINLPGLDATDVVKGVTTGLLFSRGKGTGGMLKQGGKALAHGAGVQAAIEGQHAFSGGDFNLGEVALAAGIGGASELAGPAIKTGLRHLRQAFGGEIVDPAAKQLIAASEKFNVPLMTSDVMKPETMNQKMLQAIGERIPFVGTGGLRKTQKVARVEAAEDLMREFAADVGEDYAPQIINSMKKVNVEKMRKAADMRKSSEGVLDQMGSVKPAKTHLMISELVNKETGKQFPDKAIIKYLSELQEGIVDAPFSAIRETRSQIKDKASEMYKGQNTQIGSTNAPIFTKIAGAIDEDLTDFARASGSKEAYRDWRVGNQLFREEYVKLKSSALKNVLDKGEIKPEVIRAVLNQNAPSQAKLLYKSLNKEGRDNTKRLLLQDAYKQATSDSTGDFSADAFATALSRKDPINSVFFTTEDKMALDGFVKLIQATKQAGTANTWAQTGMQTGGFLTAGGGAIYLGANPVATALIGGGAGLMTRMMESKAVRNLTLRLAETPRTSPAYDKLIDKAMSIVTPMLQSTELERKTDKIDNTEVLYGNY